MSSVVIPNTQPFGAITNGLIASLYQINNNLPRLQAALNTASGGYSGTAGTEYEGTGTLFGVVADPANAGAQGQAYASAVVTIQNAWNTFWQAASGAIDTLDNGSRSVV